MRRRTTYEAIELLRECYVQNRAPPLYLRNKHANLWRIAWSAQHAATNEPLPAVPFNFDSVLGYLRTLSTWKFVQVDGDALLHHVSHFVHHGDVDMDDVDDMLRALEPMWLANVTLTPLTIVGDVQPLNCLHANALKLALEAPDVRQSALNLFYRRVRRAHEELKSGVTATSLAQRLRPRHALMNHRHNLLHAGLGDLHGADLETFQIAQLHCVLLGQQQFSFITRCVACEAELSVMHVQDTPIPIVAQRRTGWCVLYQGKATCPQPVEQVLAMWRHIVLREHLNPIDGRHDVTGV